MKAVSGQCRSESILTVRDLTEKGISAAIGRHALDNRVSYVLYVVYVSDQVQEGGKVVVEFLICFQHSESDLMRCEYAIASYRSATCDRN
jgi:hypothetical protein